MTKFNDTLLKKTINEIFEAAISKLSAHMVQEQELLDEIGQAIVDMECQFNSAVFGTYFGDFDIRLFKDTDHKTSIGELSKARNDYKKNSRRKDPVARSLQGS